MKEGNYYHIYDDRSTMAEDSLMILLEEALGGPLETRSLGDTTTTKMKLCPVPGCNRSVKRLWNHSFQFHKKEGKYTGKCTFTVFIVIQLLLFLSDADLRTFLKAERPTPPVPPPTPTSFEGCILDALTILNEETDPTPSEVPPTRALQTCPIPGCGKKVARIWNHVNQFHKKKAGLTGKFIFNLL